MDELRINYFSWTHQKSEITRKATTREKTDKFREKQQSHLPEVKHTKLVGTLKG